MLDGLKPYEQRRVLNGRMHVVKKDSYDGTVHHREVGGCSIAGDDTVWFKNAFNRESYKLGYPADKYLS